MRRWMLASAIAVVAAVGMCGCVSQPSPFDGKQATEDRLPDAVAQYAEGADLATSRYQGRVGAWDLYLMRGDEPYGVCIAYTDGTPEHAGSGCSGGTWVRVALSDGSEFEANLNGFLDTPRKGELQVSPWVRKVQRGEER